MRTANNEQKRKKKKKKQFKKEKGFLCNANIRNRRIKEKQAKECE